MADQRQYFGTDGVRGLANQHPMTSEFAVALGAAAAQILANHKGESRPVAVIGRDTRASGEMLEAALAAGLTSAGIDVELAGVLPTPGIAHLVASREAALGAVISASHNPAPDNGIKLLAKGGEKLTDEQELAIEASMDADSSADAPTGSAIGRIRHLPSDRATDEYVRFARSTFGSGNLDGMKIAVDNANGASSDTTPAALKALGAEVITFHSSPDGNNINDGCGCTYPGVIESLVRETGADIGISHDGDADRVVLCDSTGSALDGDEILAITAAHMLEDGTLRNNTVVATVMSNAGLENAIQAVGGKVVRSDVGDRYVLKAMAEGNYCVGGEQSGHIIFGDLSTTGDGLVTALQVLRIISETGTPLHELRKVITKLPQLLKNLPVAAKPPLDTLTNVQKEVSEVESTLAGKGRVFLRYSGTESKVRILIEGEDQSYLETAATQIASAFEKDLS